MRKLSAIAFLFLCMFAFFSCQTTGGSSSKAGLYKPGEIIKGKDGKPLEYRNKSLGIAVDISSNAIVIPRESLDLMETEEKKVDFMMSHADLSGKTVMVAVENLGEEYEQMDDELVTWLLMENPAFVATYSEQFKQSIEARGYTVKDIYVDEIDFMGDDTLVFCLEGEMASIPIVYIVIFTKVGRYLRNVLVGATSYDYCIEQIAKIKRY
ncbi:MAG: hypothetical protein J6S91_12880 [Treponema sp.]|nr:hypothetical protein [Treponema sp.]